MPIKMAKKKVNFKCWRGKFHSLKERVFTLGQPLWKTLGLPYLLKLKLCSLSDLATVPLMTHHRELRTFVPQNTHENVHSNFIICRTSKKQLNCSLTVEWINTLYSWNGILYSDKMNTAQVYTTMSMKLAM